MEEAKTRLVWLALASGLVLALIFSRSVFLSLFMGGHYASLAYNNGLKREKIEAQRGRIVDSSGKVLAESIRPEEVKIEEGEGSEEGGGQRWLRFYPYGEMTAHILGYIKEGEGVSGIEAYYNQDLTGLDGEITFELNAAGKKIKQIGKREALVGKEVKLNLDIELQQAVYLALKEKVGESGEAVAMVSQVGGKVLAMVSLPSFDNNLFIAGSSRRGLAGGRYSRVEEVVADELLKPLLNRAVAGAYAPGSVYKLVPALAGLEEKVVSEADLIEDTGEIKVGEERFGNWYFDQYGQTEGEVDIKKALARSNDIYFYKLGERLGVDKLVSWSKRLGLGEKTGIDLGSEVEGLVPDPLWRERRFGLRWYLGNTYHMAIGQGDLLVSPLQINRMTAAVVSGQKCRPSLRQVLDSECKDLKIEEKSIEVIREGMRAACMRGGTAFPFFDLEGKVICKTGTAQQGGEEEKPHAWINVVVPKGDNEMDWMVVTVMLPEGGEGSYEAGPVAREIVDWILQK